MDFGVSVPSAWAAKRIVEIGLAADKIGLDFFLTTDHYLSPSTNTSSDAWTVLASIATGTKRIRLGTCVTPIPLRPPPILAKIVATVDQLSDGRVILGVGAGWNKHEFTAYSTWDPDSVRVDKTLEGIKLMMKLWTADTPFDFQGKYYRVENAILEPKPVQKPHPPLWFGTIGSRMLKIASKYADAWLPLVTAEFSTIDMYEYVISTLRQHEAKLRRQQPVKIKFNGTIKDISDKIEIYVKMGCDGAILVRTPYEEIISAMRQLADIAASYR